tara:strand:- start:43 stop:1671 length:1629 start_codon:yes stop_codon:yes gene_type:complete
MPISKIKTTGVDLDNLEIGGTEAARMPQGTTGERVNAQVGDIRYNSTIGTLEQYNANGWQAISSPPVVNSVSPDNIDESDDPQTIVISGANFDTGATGVLITSGGATVSPTTSTRNSSSQLTMVFSGSDTVTPDQGPYDIKITNSTGLSGQLDDAITLDDAPDWSTAAGSLGTVIEDVAMSTINVSATDPEGGTVTYSVTSGALPTGTSLSSAGAITGTPNVGTAGYSSSGVSHNFTITANDGTGNTTPRAFSILRKWQDGSTADQASTSPEALRGLGVADGIYQFKFSSYNSGNAFPARFATYNNRGWIEVLVSRATNTNRPWLDWLYTTNAGYDGNQSSAKYYLRNHQNLSGGGMDLTGGNTNSIILLGNAVTWTDIAFTTKSSLGANGVAASGQNQGSQYPMIAGSGGGANLQGTDAATVKTQLCLYFSGQRDGFHAGRFGSGVDYDAWWPGTGGASTGFDIILAYRVGSVSTTEWHIKDGVDNASSTYAPNYGYRTDGTGTPSTYLQANVGGHNTGTDGKTAYNISTSNVMSIWLTDS